jgi:hypothetical protein
MTERAEAERIPVWIAPQRPGFDFAWVLRFARDLRRARVDVLHSHEFAMNTFGSAAALLAARAGDLDDPWPQLGRGAAAARTRLSRAAAARHPDRRGVRGPRGLSRRRARGYRARGSR